MRAVYSSSSPCETNIALDGHLDSSQWLQDNAQQATATNDAAISPPVVTCHNSSSSPARRPCAFQQPDVYRCQHHSACRPLLKARRRKTWGVGRDYLLFATVHQAPRLIVLRRHLMSGLLNRLSVAESAPVRTMRAKTRSSNAFGGHGPERRGNEADGDVC